MISLCMIVKNEEDVIGRCLESVKLHLSEVVDEFVVVDTGSTDNTVSIAKEYGAKIFNFEWCDDFSKARNFSVEKAKNDWVIILDADEYVDSVNILELKSIQAKKYETVKASLYIRDIDNNGVISSLNPIARVFNKKFYKFDGIIHEQVVHKFKFTTQLYKLKLYCNHTGYNFDIIASKNKVERNKKLIKEYLKENPNDQYMTGQLGLVYKMENRCEDAIRCLEGYVFNDKLVGDETYTLFTVVLMKSLIELEQYEAVVVCEKLWEYCKDSDEYVYLLSIGYFKSGRYEKAIDGFMMCLNWEGERAIDIRHSYHSLGMIFEAFKEYEQAIICFENCGDFEDSIQRLENIKKIIKKH